MSNPDFDTGDGSDSADATIRGTERSTASSGAHAGEVPPAEYCAQVATRVTVTPRSWRIDDTGADIDFADRMGLNHEVWACERPGSPLVSARTRWRDVIDARSFRPVEIKACCVWLAESGTHGHWQLRYPQHSALKRRDGYYLFVVYAPVPTQGVGAEVQYAVSMPPSELEARCEGALGWRTHDDTSFGRIRLAAVAWPALVTEEAAGVEDLFTRSGESVGLESVHGKTVLGQSGRW